MVVEGICEWATRVGVTLAALTLWFSHVGWYFIGRLAVGTNEAHV